MGQMLYFLGYIVNTYTVQFWWRDPDYLEDPGRRWSKMLKLFLRRQFMVMWFGF